MRLFNIFKTLFAVIIICWSQISFAAMSNEDMLNKLNELSTIIQKQQLEIEMLKQELKHQKESINQVKETQKEDITKSVKTETEEKSKEWSENIPKWIKDTKVSGDLRLRYEAYTTEKSDRPTDPLKIFQTATDSESGQDSFLTATSVMKFPLISCSPPIRTTI